MAGPSSLGRTVRRPGVHEAVVDGHGHDGAAVRVDVLHYPDDDMARQGRGKEYPPHFKYRVVRKNSCMFELSRHLSAH